jgi:hypothetical protein
MRRSTPWRQQRCLARWEFRIPAQSDRVRSFAHSAFYPRFFARAMPAASAAAAVHRRETDRPILAVAHFTHPTALPSHRSGGLVEMRGDPGVQLLPIDRRQLAAVGAQQGSLAAAVS